MNLQAAEAAGLIAKMELVMGKYWILVLVLALVVVFGGCVGGNGRADRETAVPGIAGRVATKEWREMWPDWEMSFCTNSLGELYWRTNICHFENGILVDDGWIDGSVTNVVEDGEDERWREYVSEAEKGLALLSRADGVVSISGKAQVNEAPGRWVEIVGDGLMCSTNYWGDAVGFVGGVDTGVLLWAIGEKEMGEWKWSDAGEYGPHNVTVDVVIDFLRAEYPGVLQHRENDVVRNFARMYLECEYGRVTGWHLARLISKCPSQNRSTRARVRFVSAAWVSGLRGASLGRGHAYSGDVLNLYEDNRRKK